MASKNSNYIVRKFGGTSVGSIEAITIVSDIICAESNPQIIVCSAMSGVTNSLQSIALKASEGDSKYQSELKSLKEKHLNVASSLLKGDFLAKSKEKLNLEFTQLEAHLYGVFLTKELSPKMLDATLSVGERWLCILLTELLLQNARKAALCASQELIATDNNFGNAEVHLDSSYENIKKKITDPEQIVVVPGFSGRSESGDVSTLGRGGSDYSAAILARGIQAKVLEIWTDVDGIMTADPKKVKKAKVLSELSYEEVMELTYFGAKVIYPPTIQPVYNQIPIHLRNTFNQQGLGTFIRKKTSNDTSICGITAIENIALITLTGSGMVGISGVAARFFQSLARKNINIILIAQASSEHSISVAINDKNSRIAEKAIRQEFELELEAGKVNAPEILNNLAIGAIVGDNMKQTPNISGRLFTSLGRNGVNIVSIAQGTSERNISFVMNEKDIEKAINGVHESFFQDSQRSIHVFVVGTGTVGQALLEQINKQQKRLFESSGIDVKMVGIANSRKMLFNSEGISLSNWSKSLDASTVKSNPDDFIATIKKLNLRNSILVDVTANDIYPNRYLELLNKSVSIVTANKIAASRSLKEFKELESTAAKRAVHYLYETNVGAGLPIVSTLHDLMRSGDSVHKIEAVLSGTMNFVMDCMSKGMEFSDAVEKAKELGFTEPNPANDLSGLDVARKILILSRVAGNTLELSDVSIKTLLPKETLNLSTDSFMQALTSFNKEFSTLLENAKSKNRKAVYMASLADGNANVGIQEVGELHPFYNLEGTNNAVLFYTNRYPKEPLMVRGPGAGAEVTAAGLFADIIRTAPLHS